MKAKGIKTPVPDKVKFFQIREDHFDRLVNNMRENSPTFDYLLLDLAYTLIEHGNSKGKDAEHARNKGELLYQEGLDMLSKAQRMKVQTLRLKHWKHEYAGRPSTRVPC